MGAFDDLNTPTGGAFDDLKAPTISGKPVSTLEKIARGMKDPLDGAAQLFERVMPQGFNDANHAVNNWIADKTGLLAKVPERNTASLITGQKTGVDGLIQQQERDYQARRAAAGESGFDGYRTIGNIASPVNLAIAAKLPVAASLVGKVGIGTAGGAASSALNPVSGDDYWSEKAKQTALGAAFGAAVPAVTSALGRLISPKASVNPDLAVLKAEGVNPTIGQTLGGWVNRMEERAQSMPIMGASIRNARSAPAEELNRAAVNRALEPIGQKLPIDVKLGNDAVLYTRKTLGNAYDNLLPKLTTQADDTFVGSVQKLRGMVQESALDPKYVTQFNKIMDNRVLGKFQGQNTMTGQTLKDTQSFLTNEIKRYSTSPDPDARLMGNALKEVGAELNSLVVRSNPELASELKSINTGYANFKRVQRAASSVAAEDGVFNPSQLHNAVKVGDYSKDKARFSEGNALMQDLSSAGKNMIANKVPDSGTTERLLANGSALASGFIHPAIPAALAGGALMYSKPLQSLLRGAVSARPQSAKAIADSLNQASPLLIPASAQVGLGLLNY